MQCDMQKVTIVLKESTHNTVKTGHQNLCNVICVKGQWKSCHLL